MDGHGFKRAELDALERVVGDPREKPVSLTFPLLEYITSGFSGDSIIGRGGFAVVYLGVLPSGLRIAVKKLHHQTNHESAFANEVCITMRAAHKNIVRLIGYCSHTSIILVEHQGQSLQATVRESLICVEYVPNGSLDKHITDRFHGGLDWNQRYQILKGISQGLSHIHNKMHVVHGDIKPGNILLEDDLAPKIFDFGLSKRLNDEGDSLILGDPSPPNFGLSRRSDGEADSFINANIAGTMGYMAPEMIVNGCWSIKSDIFSLGITIMELLIGSRQGWEEQSVEQVLNQLRKRLLKEGAFSSWENKYHQVRTCLEIGCNCVDMDPDKRPTASDIIQRLDETESTNHSAPSFWQMQSGEEESDSSDTDTSKTKNTTTEFVRSDEEPTSADTTGETSTLETDKPDLVSKLPALVDLSDLKFLEKITDDFSHKRILGKDGTLNEGPHKAFVYKGDIPRREMIAVKRLIGVEIPVEKFKREAEQFISLNHNNIVKVAGYCHDHSRGHRLVHFKGEPLPQFFNGPEQLLCYEYMHNGSLHDYFIGQGSREIDWKMRYKLIKGTCAGLHYLHKGHANCPIVHLNLSPSNVLLDENYIPRITGFDFSKLIGEKNTKSVVVKTNGSIAYLPPDFFYSKGTDLKYLVTVDIYSLGLIILQITTQQEIKGKHGALIKSIEENWREESQIAQQYASLEDDELRQVKMCIDIGLECVKTKPEKRPTAGTIMLWLDKGSKPVPVPRAGAVGGVPRPPVPANITLAGIIQEKEKAGFLKRHFGWKK